MLSTCHASSVPAILARIILGTLLLGNLAACSSGDQDVGSWWYNQRWDGPVGGGDI